MLSKENPQNIPEFELLLKIAQGIFSPANPGKLEPLVNLNTINWEAFKKLVEYHRIIAFVYPALEPLFYSLPGTTVQWLTKVYLDAAYCSSCQWSEFLRIYQPIKSAGLNLFPIKGIALLPDIYSGVKWVRKMNDIDVICRKESFNQIQTILENLGYTSGLTEKGKSFCLANDRLIVFKKYNPDIKFNFLVEVHWKLNVRKKDFMPVWTKTREICIADKTIELLSPEDTFLSLCFHYERAGWRFFLSNILEIGLLLNKYGSSFDWDYILNKSVEGKIRSIVFFVLREIELLFPINIPPKIITLLKIPVIKQRLITIFIKNNLFKIPPSPNKHHIKILALLYDSPYESIKLIFQSLCVVFFHRFRRALHKRLCGILPGGKPQAT